MNPTQLNLLNDVAPETPWWSWFYLQNDQFTNEKLRTLAKAFPKLWDLDKRVIFNRIKDRRYELGRALSSYFLSAFFWRIFSSLTPEKIVDRTSKFDKVIAVMRAATGSPAAYLDLNQPLAHEFPERISHQPLETMRINLLSGEVLVKANWFSSSYFLIWHDKGYEKNRKVLCSSTNEYVRKLCFIRMVNQFNEILYDDGKPKIRFVKDVKEYYGVYSRKISNFDRSLLYLDYKGVFLYYNDGIQRLEDKSHDLEINHLANLSILITTFLDHVNDHQTIKTKLKKKFKGYFFSSDTPTKINKLDIGVYLKDNRQQQVGVILPDRIDTYSYDQLNVTAMDLQNEQAKIIEDLLKPLKGRIIFKSFDDTFLEVRTLVLSPVGVKFKTLLIPYRECSDQQLDTFLEPLYTKEAIQEFQSLIISFDFREEETHEFLSILPPDDQIDEMCQQVKLFAEKVKSSKYLYDPEKQYNPFEISIAVEEIPGAEMPRINYVWYDTYGVLDYLPLPELSEKYLDDHRHIKIKILLTETLSKLTLEKEQWNFKFFYTIKADSKKEEMYVHLKSLDDDPILHKLSVHPDQTVEDLFQQVHTILLEHQQLIKDELKIICVDPGTVPFMNKSSEKSPWLKLNENKGHEVHFTHPLTNEPYVIKTRGVSLNSIRNAFSKLLKIIQLYDALEAFIVKDKSFHILQIRFDNPRLFSQICLQAFNQNPKAKTAVFAKEEGLSYAVYYRNPLFKNRFCFVEIHSVEEIARQFKKIDENIEEIKLFSLGDDLLNRTSQFTPETIPPIVEGKDIHVIKKYHKMVNFQDPESPFYINPIMGTTPLNHPKTYAKIEEFYAHEKDNKPPVGLSNDSQELKAFYDAIRAYLTQIIAIIDETPNQHEKLVIAMQVVEALCYCSWRWGMALSSLYSVLKGLLKGANYEDYPFDQVSLSYGDLLKEGTVHEMAVEVYTPKNSLEARNYAEVGIQTTHIKKAFVKFLQEKNIVVPNSAIALFSDKFEKYILFSNYRTPQEVEEGFYNVLNSPSLIDNYHEWYNRDLKNLFDKVGYPIYDLLLAFIEQFALNHPLPNSFWKPNVHVQNIVLTCNNRIIKSPENKRQACAVVLNYMNLHSDEDPDTSFPKVLTRQGTIAVLLALKSLKLNK